LADPICSPLTSLSLLDSISDFCSRGGLFIGSDEDRHLLTSDVAPFLLSTKGIPGTKLGYRDALLFHLPLRFGFFRTGSSFFPPGHTWVSSPIRVTSLLCVFLPIRTPLGRATPRQFLLTRVCGKGGSSLSLAFRFPLGSFRRCFCFLSLLLAPLRGPGVSFVSSGRRPISSCLCYFLYLTIPIRPFNSFPLFRIVVSTEPSPSGWGRT